MRTVIFFPQDLIQIVRKVAPKVNRKNNSGVIRDIASVNTETAFNYNMGVLDNTVAFSDR